MFTPFLERVFKVSFKPNERAMSSSWWRNMRMSGKWPTSMKRRVIWVGLENSYSGNCREIHRNALRNHLVTLHCQRCVGAPKIVTKMMTIASSVLSFDYASLFFAIYTSPLTYFLSVRISIATKTELPKPCFSNMLKLCVKMIYNAIQLLD